MTTVGSLIAGPNSAPSSWKAHEGHPGYRIDQLEHLATHSQYNFTPWLEFKPDIITMHVGTNDCMQKATAGMAIDRMRSLLNMTVNALPGAKVFVASIIDLPPQGKDCQQGLNEALPGLLKELDGAKVYYVPLAEQTIGMCGPNKTYFCEGK